MSADTFPTSETLAQRIAAQRERGEYRTTAMQRPDGRGRDGDPASAGVVRAMEPTWADPSGDEGVLPSPSPGHSGGTP